MIGDVPANFFQMSNHFLEIVHVQTHFHEIKLTKRGSEGIGSDPYILGDVPEVTNSYRNMP